MSAALAKAFDDMPAPRRLKVIASPVADVDALRTELTVPHGLTVREIVRQALPGGTRLTYRRTHVWLVSRDGEQLLERRAWRARPKPHVTIVIRVEPGRNGLGSLLQIVVAIGAAMVAPWLAGTLFGLQAGTTAFGVVSGVSQLALNAAGGLLINALFPTKQEQSSRQQSFAATGWANEQRRDAPIPRLYGRLRMAPIFAVPPVMEEHDDEIWLRAAFLWGGDRTAHSDYKIGDTPLSEFVVQGIEHRYGYPEDAPLSLITRTVIPQPLGQGGVTLTRLLPRDADGNPDEGAPGISKPVTRRCARDATSASIILCFPYGLIFVDDKNRKQSSTARIAIRYRQWGAPAWTELTTLEIVAKKERAFYREHQWDFPSRGDWEVQLEMMTDEEIDSGIVRDCQWALLKTIRPEYPINYGKPLSLTAILVKSSDQFNGTINQFNGLACSIANDFVPADAETGAWVEQQTAWPPALALKALQGNSNPFPVGEPAIDRPAFEAWQRFCAAKGLEYGRMHETREPLRNGLKAIGAAGRAVVHFNGVKWTVTIDRPRDTVAGHLNAQNCSEIRGRVDYLKLPDAFRVTFRDKTSGYEPKDMIVPFPGREPPFDRVEKIDRPWITDPAQLFCDIRRYQLELVNRHVTWTATQRRGVRSASYGDMLIASRDFLAPGIHSARVRSRRGRLVEIETPYEFAAGQDYWVRWLRHSEGSPYPASIQRPIKALPGRQATFRLDGDGDAPAADDIVHLVPASGGGMEMILIRREPGKGKTSVLTLKAAAPQIDAELDATPVPPWTGRTGVIVDADPPAPAVPVIAGIDSGIVATGAADGLVVRLRPGAGSAAVGSYEVRHRLAAAAPAWSGPAAAPAANGAVDLSGVYAAADAIELEARALSYGGAPGGWTATVAHTLAAGDGATPAAIPLEAVTVTAGLGHLTVAVATGADTATEAVQVYHRDTPGALDETADKAGAPIAVEPLQTYGRVIGDGTRTDMIGDGGFDTGTPWAAGLWSIAAGVASKTAGTGGAISQALTLPAGDYAVAFDLAVSAGQVRPRLTGGSAHPAADGAWTAAAGRHRAVLGSDGTKTALAIEADAAFAGSIDNVVVYRRSGSALAAGEHRIWVRPIGATLDGPLTGPITRDTD